MQLPSAAVNTWNSNPHAEDRATIRGLPEHLQEVPAEAHQWMLWSKAVAAYREKRRRECERDVRQQNIERERCARDPAYFSTIWGVIFEARAVAGTPPSWKPFILFHFQVQMIRWIEHVLTEEDAGRGDGIIEKSRDMGATNIFCLFMAHHFIFEQVFVAGVISRTYDAVYKKNSSDTVFYKIQSLLGIEDGVPSHLRLPKFLQPKGFDKDLHLVAGAMKNPEPGKTCFIVGETTTKLSGVGGRSTMRLNDEAARWTDFEQAWDNQQATTDHRFALSSADTKNPLFQEMAKRGQDALLNPYIEAPSYLRLNWWLQPFHTREWFDQQKARARAGNQASSFAREYEIDYTAAEGDYVYPRFLEVTVGDHPYDPLGGPMYCWIDNGIRDPASLIYVQVEPTTGLWNVVDHFEGQGGEDVTFYASVMTGTYLSGQYGYDYDRYPGIHQFMEFTANIRHHITYIGDPAGHERAGRGDEESSWYKELSRAAREMSTRTIYVQSITGRDARTHNTRNTAVNKLMHRVRFNANVGGRRVLECLQKSRYPRPTRVEITEPNKPRHDAYSHCRTAFEWGCTYLYLTENMPHGQGEVKALRLSKAGNLVSGKQRELFVRR